ncbi:hypothetical protein BDV96DRAFT_594448 [Lophiotrema nucula]|uniref:Uncharacterized protein n=1 Tax=Lophiotrema nucula TaxID=690887 RepID=A0A6A5ZNJ5_9PLEO|nr:hypothetical protein BDV96DRAFT_594448 [Lophiotrema nucula]
MRYSTLLLLATTACAQRLNPYPSLHLPTRASGPLPTLFKRDTFAEPCEEVSASWAAAGPEATRVLIGGQLAYDCLTSVPVDTDGDLVQIQELKNFVEFQTTTSYLKDPEFRILDNPVVDVQESLDQIAAGVKNGSFTSEFHVQQALRLLFLSAGDFHFQWQADILGVLPIARIGGAVLQLSKDGVALPELYLQTDVTDALVSNFTPSVITTINGQNATEYLYNVSRLVDYHDSDARYNRVFANQALGAIGDDSDGPWITQEVYDGPETKFGFANGTNATIQTVAVLRPQIFNFSGVTDGLSFFNKFCQGVPDEEPEASAVPTPTANSTTAVSTFVPAPTQVPGYPKPVMLQSSLKFQGYFLNGSDYSDVVVLAIPAFDPTIGEGTNETDPNVETQKKMRSFFEFARSSGKKKLVIDLRGNGGGTIDMGYETFKQLFPSEEPFGGTRYRAHESWEVFTAAVSDFVANTTFAETNETGYAGVVQASATLAYQGLLNETHEPFKNFREYYGPYIHNNDTFTALRRYNFSNNINGYTQAGSGFELTGYLSNSPAPPQPFEAPNIVILQDGLCGSTCAIFSELMREQGHVQTISIGGRPQNGPMQTIGGTKGAQVLNMGSIVSLFGQALQVTLETMGLAVAKRVENTAFGAIINTTQLYIRTSHLSASNPLFGRVNSLDNLRQNDTEQVPLEFIYEAADCRLFETLASRQDPTVLWKLAVDAKWGNGKCVDGSMGDKTAIGVVTNQTFNANNQQNLTEPTSGAVTSTKASGMMVGIVAIVSAALLVL